ncbi:hypothetical protein JRO89_XS11G0195100 [Xanthoceras sorbifolium]|uniref:Uncharacterized protein n=1 Tax=Xanthoceras sorbifolium TaxID=99658 RepID=A0ABQ8HG93_9ROSI|nr:hypothetical protein JRO89_XS11G0195100 [Xanthoceras sorbifolium]
MRIYGIVLRQALCPGKACQEERRGSILVSTHKLCSPRCYDSCTNIVDLFFDLAAVYFFPNYVKQKKQMNTGICEIRSSGFTAPGPISSLKYPAALLSAPAMVPY